VPPSRLARPRRIAAPSYASAGGSASAPVTGPGREDGVQLQYSLGPNNQEGAALGNPLFELLSAVVEGGSIRQAAELLGTSYRYVWDAVRRWERQLGEPLVAWSQGRRARPTQFAHKLLWAERSVRIRMQPHIEALRTDLSRVLAYARDGRQHLLTMRASHDLALPLLQRHLAATADLHLDLGFCGSVEALRALNDRQCLIAGFHVPVMSGNGTVFARTLKPLLRPRAQTLIACARRTQGLMVRKEHAHAVRALADVVRQGLRFVNRQAGSGTRMLVDQLMAEHDITPCTLPGYHEHVEHTHVAVGLCVAGGMGDAGVGIAAAARQFGLHFVPLVEENYYIACLDENLHNPAVHNLRSVLAGPQWRRILAGLPGYDSAAAPGELLIVGEALPWWRRRSGRKS